MKKPTVLHNLHCKDKIVLFNGDRETMGVLLNSNSRPLVSGQNDGELILKTHMFPALLLSSLFSGSSCTSLQSSHDDRFTLAIGCSCVGVAYDY